MARRRALPGHTARKRHPTMGPTLRTRQETRKRFPDDVRGMDPHLFQKIQGKTRADARTHHEKNETRGRQAHAILPHHDTERDHRRRSLKMAENREKRDTFPGWLREDVVHAQTPDASGGERGIESRESLQVHDSSIQAEERGHTPVGQEGSGIDRGRVSRIHAAGGLAVRPGRRLENRRGLRPATTGPRP